MHLETLQGLISPLGGASAVLSASLRQPGFAHVLAWAQRLTADSPLSCTANAD